MIENIQSVDIKKKPHKDNSKRNQDNEIQDNKNIDNENQDNEKVNKSNKNQNLNLKKNKNYDECVELKNINYKNMLLKGSNLSNNNEKYDNNILDKFLSDESEMNKKEHWLKLDKPNKLIKLKKYGEVLINKYNLTKSEIINLNNFFGNCIDLKKINKVKDIEYDKEIGEIISIPIILFNESNRSFYIKKCDKHISTLKSIPQKKNKTIKQ